MKKFLFVVIAIVAMSFAACGNKVTPASSNGADSDSIVDSTVVDSVDSVCVK